MSTSVIVRYRTTPDAADENQRLIEDVYAELAGSAPDGFRYTTFRLADQVSFVHVAVLEGEDNPLTRSAAFARFQEDLPARVVDPPVATAAAQVGSYGF